MCLSQKNVHENVFIYYNSNIDNIYNNENDDYDSVFITNNNNNSSLINFYKDLNNHFEKLQFLYFLAFFIMSLHILYDHFIADLKI